MKRNCFCLLCGSGYSADITPSGITGLCTTCCESLSWMAFHHCGLCGKELLNLNFSPGDLCISCVLAESDSPITRIVSSLRYQGRSRRIITMVKFLLYRPGIEIWTSLFRQGLNNLGIMEEDLVELVPIPASAQGMRTRGFDPVLEAVSKLAKYQKLPVNTCIIRKAGQSQKLADRNERLQQAKLQYSIRKHCVKPERLIAVLFDDLRTTGASLRICGELLKELGYSRVYAVTLAQD